MENRLKKGLGRGLSSLLGDTSKKIETNKVPIKDLIRNKFQPRKKFNKESLDELTNSIKEQGVIQPIVVRPDKNANHKYEIIAGERRWLASQNAGLHEVPVVILDVDDVKSLVFAIVENVQMQDLNHIEEARGYQRLIDECKLTQEACSDRIGKNRTTVTNFLRLLKLPSTIQKGLSEGKISTGHARALINVKSDKNQINIYHDTVAHGYSVREIEQIVKTFADTIYKRISKDEIIKTPHPFSHQKMIHDLSRKLDSSVDLKRNKKGKGKIIIPFNTDDDFEKIVEIINK